MTLWKMAVLAAPLALAGPGPGQERLFGNWAVVCDNVKHCEATALMPEGWHGDQAPGLDITREAGAAGAVTIALSPSAETYGIVDILIDRKLMSSGPIRDGTITLTGATAEGLARAMAAGRQVTLRAHGKIVGTLPLAGASAAMRHIDAEQGRAGGVTALVARGKASAAAVPGAKPLPRIQAVRPGKGRAATLTAGETDQLRLGAGCGDHELPDGLKTEFHRLDGRTTLVTVPCISGAYQTSYALYVLREGRAVPAPFDIAPGEEGGTGVSWLVEAEWDPATATLDSRAKSRGLGDCGKAQSWVWDGTRFRMTRYIALDACRLSGNYLQRYRAEAVFK
jgi:hypothetical protein